MFTGLAVGLFIGGVCALLIALDLYEGRRAERKLEELPCVDCEADDYWGCPLLDDGWVHPQNLESRPRHPGLDASEEEIAEMGRAARWN